jgi:hypothetical protein
MIMSGYGGWPKVGNMVPAGRLLVLDGGPSIYGYGRLTYRAGAGHVHADAAQDYKLFAEVLEPRPKAQEKAKGKKKRRQTRRREITWSTALPFVARSLVLTRDALLVAGGKLLTESAERHGAGTFWVVSRQDGTKLVEHALPAPPILDGMAFTENGIFVSTVDRAVLCLTADGGAK